MGDVIPVRYEVNCFQCSSRFDAMEASWCSCLAIERSLVCPNCLHCFCAAPHRYKKTFWEEAPQELWDRKLEEHRADSEEAVNPPPEEAMRPLVLLVDDEKDVRRVAVRKIRSLGYGVIVATNGNEGIELAHRYRPDLILSDAMMPGLDGREMCRMLKTDPTTKDLRIVVMTSLYTSARHKAEANREFLVDDYLSKPLNFEELRSVLAKFLG